MAKTVIMASWDDVPHLDDAAKADMLASYPLYQRDARSKGVPQLGSGAIYPIPESDIKVDPFPIPPHWPRGFGLDVGWNFTAAIFGAIDRETDTAYLYDEYYAQKQPPDVHAASIRRRGEWMPGRIDPASRGRSQSDGTQLLQSYADLGLNLGLAPNGVEAGIFDMYQRFTTGRLKVFSILQNFWTEYRLYRRDEKGNITKKLDHAMDAGRYLIAGGCAWMQLDPNYLTKMGMGKSANVAREDEYRATPDED